MMRVDVYGKFQLEIAREDGRWVAYKVDAVKRARMCDLVIPDWLDEAGVVEHLDDLYHEAARPGQTVRIISGT